MTYSLTKEGDYPRGDSGQMSIFIYEDDGNKITYENNARPRIGGIIRVGSHYARTYAMQDYWQTSRIVEILEDTEDMVRFRTLNSIYVWRCKL